MATLFIIKRKLTNIRLNYRHFSETVTETTKKALILGAYTEQEKGNLVLTKSAQSYDASICGKLSAQLNQLACDFKKGSTRILYGLDKDNLAVCVVGLGKRCQTFDELEEIDHGKEDVRSAAAAGAAALQGIGIEKIEVENLDDAESAAEGVTLQLWRYQELKNEEKRKKLPTICFSSDNEEEVENWELGVKKAEAQNLARRLMETPANLMTPTIFAQNAKECFSNLKNVEVIVRDESWAKQQRMNSFLSVAKGSSEPPAFVEILYQGAEKTDSPYVFVGKGVTFDSGGISIKGAQAMDEMRGDMGGGACVFATIHAAARLQLPLNIIGLIPLCENMPSGTATKPGDVVRAMNGKSIQVNNTDAEGRLILADALCYSQSFSPKYLIDIATLTGAIRIALGSGASGVFSNSTKLWNDVREAGWYTGDRMWRLPLWKVYSKRMTDFPSFDVHNVGKGKGAGACTAAAFLREFVPDGVEWMHIDIAGVMGVDDDTPYIGKGMTGRPTRTLVELLIKSAQYK